MDSSDNFCPPVGQVGNELDLRMMSRCIALSRDSVAAGELPFGCVICRDGEVVAESTNRVKRDRDVMRHAEMVAMSRPNGCSAPSGCRAVRSIPVSSLAGCALIAFAKPACARLPMRSARPL
jgi:tRNA(Arg) A34 adenosine deaminase TadA